MTAKTGADPKTLPYALTTGMAMDILMPETFWIIAQAGKMELILTRMAILTI